MFMLPGLLSVLSSCLAAGLSVARVMAAVTGQATGRHSKVSMSQPSLCCSALVISLAPAPAHSSHSPTPPEAQHRASQAQPIRGQSQTVPDQSEPRAEYLASDPSDSLSTSLKTCVCKVTKPEGIDVTKYSNSVHFDSESFELHYLYRKKTLKFRTFFCFLSCLFT